MSNNVCITQGSGIGPCLYVICASHLHTLLPQNVIINYADDTTLLVAQHSSIDTDQEYNVHSWSTQNKLSINTDSLTKLKKLFFTALLLETFVDRLLIPLPGIEFNKQRYLKLM